MLQQSLRFIQAEMVFQAKYCSNYFKHYEVRNIKFPLKKMLIFLYLVIALTQKKRTSNSVHYTLIPKITRATTFGKKKTKGYKH